MVSRELAARCQSVHSRRVAYDNVRLKGRCTRTKTEHLIGLSITSSQHWQGGICTGVTEYPASCVLMAWGIPARSPQLWPCRSAVRRSTLRARLLHTQMVLVCERCGAQYASAPSLCILCSDERGSLERDGQRWLTVDQLHKGHKNVLLEEESDILGIGVEPAFGVGQRALFIQTGTYVEFVFHVTVQSTWNSAKRCSRATRWHSSMPLRLLLKRPFQLWH